MRSTTAEQLVHSVLELRRPETTNSAAQLHSNLQADPAEEQFPGNYDTEEQSTCRAGGRSPRQWPQ
jgi:hypothetical protein